jgi:hypothetical protein
MQEIRNILPWKLFAGMPELARVCCVSLDLGSSVTYTCSIPGPWPNLFLSSKQCEDCHLTQRQSQRPVALHEGCCGLELSSRQGKY